MKPYFNSVERFMQLDRVAESWRDTPFMPNAAIKGAGVSCQKLVCAIYVECGALPTTFTVDDGPMSWSRAQTESLIEKFMERHAVDPSDPSDMSDASKIVSLSANPSEKHFLALNFPSQSTFPKTGDMLGFKIDGCIHHCGVMLGQGKFIHCWLNSGVLFSEIKDATYWRRLSKIWRPIS